MLGDENEDLIDALLPAVDQQLQSSETAYVDKCLRRLVKEHRIEREEALEMIAFCLALVTDDMMKSGKEFDHKRYQKLLQKLPSLPEE